jgi:fimbrial isopeptide formation D2 family protein/LPXTG-motif cell wall-anchored protein
MGQGTEAKQVIKYEIKDTLPNYLSDVTVTSIKVDDDGNPETTDDQTSLTTTQFANKKIDITWAEAIPGSDPKKYQSIYNNGAKIIITYTAKVTAQATVGDADGNRNEVTLTPYVDNGTSSPEPWNETFKDDETIKTYGAAIHKVDDKGNNLKGAKFKIAGLTVTGTKGQYTVSNYDKTITLENSTEMEVDDEGYIYILGLASDVDLSVTETVAPKGYNKLTAQETLKPIKMSETTTYSTKTVYYDADGKVVYEETTGGSKKTINANYEDLKEEANVLTIVNKQGTELPSTGGIGTTIFYVLGGLLVVGAGIVLVARRKASE